MILFYRLLYLRFNLFLSRSELFEQINVCVFLRVILHVKEKHTIADLAI